MQGMVEKVDDILRELKHNVDGTKAVLKQWEVNLLFERKPDKTYSFGELREEFDKCVSSRHTVINDEGKKIGKNVSSSYRTLINRPEPSDWKAYTDYVSSIVINGFAAGITASITYLTAQLQVRVSLNCVHMVTLNFAWFASACDQRAVACRRQMIQTAAFVRYWRCRWCLRTIGSSGNQILALEQMTRLECSPC
jgi:hypothetical protein